MFVLLTQIPLLVSMETVGLTSSWLPWCLVLEDLSRLYTARDKQGLQPKLVPLPSCHHLLTVTRSSWGWGEMAEQRGRGLRAKGRTVTALRLPVEAGWGCSVRRGMRSHCSHSVALWAGCICLGDLGIAEDTMRCPSPVRAWILKGLRRLLGHCPALAPAQTEGQHDSFLQ